MNKHLKPEVGYELDSAYISYDVEDSYLFDDRVVGYVSDDDIKDILAFYHGLSTSVLKATFEYRVLNLNLPIFENEEAVETFGLTRGDLYYLKDVGISMAT